MNTEIIADNLSKAGLTSGCVTHTIRYVLMQPLLYLDVFKEFYKP